MACSVATAITPSSSCSCPSSSSPALFSSTSRTWKSQLCPPRIFPSCSGFRALCCSGSSPQSLRSELKFVLHDALDSAGVDTTHAKEARDGFCSEIENLSNIERETSISINRGIDLGRTALYIAAEDDSLVSHSSVPLPVDSFIRRLDDLSMGYCSHYNSLLDSSPELFLENLEKYLYVKKGFRRNNSRNLVEPRTLYLHSVLTHRSGSAVMLSLIYSEILKMLRLWGLVNFDAEIYFPHDLDSLPKGYDKQKSKESDQEHIMTSQALLVKILKDLKAAFWPFQHNRAESLFLRAAHAANCVDNSSTGEESAFQLASTKAAHYRLQRGVWTTVRLGDMRCALSACERLILLESDAKELRDYSILLYHCGFYKQSLQYLKMYRERKDLLKLSRGDLSSMKEEDAVEKLMVRLNLVLMEEGWSPPSHVRNFLADSSEPW